MLSSTTTLYFQLDAHVACGERNTLALAQFVSGGTDHSDASTTGDTELGDLIDVAGGGPHVRTVRVNGAESILAGSVDGDDA
jgi:hypothetical protein